MKKIVFSGVQPSGLLHLGNYLGALKRWVALQEGGEHDCLFCVVDLHAITVPQKPEELRLNTLRVAAAYLAAGIDPEKSVIFIQSHVPAHAELGWILNTLTPLGELERMTQFKDKTARQETTYAGLFNYPTLMAADILLYRTNLVPVGEDQVQHVELARSLAARFNRRFGETFVVPEVMLTKETARVMALDDPTKKMSKSAASAASYIALTDDEVTIRQKIKATTTDSGKEIKSDPERKPGIANLLNIMSAVTGKSIAALEHQFTGVTYSTFKEAVAEAIVTHLAPMQKRYNDLMSDAPALEQILREGAGKARARAEAMVTRVRKAVGFVAQGA